MDITALIISIVSLGIHAWNKWGLNKRAAIFPKDTVIIEKKGNTTYLKDSEGKTILEL